MENDSITTWNCVKMYIKSVTVLNYACFSVNVKKIVWQTLKCHCFEHVSVNVNVLK